MASRRGPAKLFCIWCYSAKPKIKKNHWVGNLFTVANRLRFLANHEAKQTMGIVSQFRLQLVRSKGKHSLSHSEERKRRQI